MKCQGCGHEYPSTFPRCSRCGELSPKRTLRTSQSRLLEFPRKTRVEVERESNEGSLPSWRKELNEKVRAVKARKIANGPEPQPAEAGSTQAAAVQTAPADPRTRRTESLTRTAAPAASAVKAEAVSQGPKTSNAIVEAALTRVRRATENATRAALSRIEPARPPLQNSTPSMVIDREATARALEIDISTTPTVEAPPLSSGFEKRHTLQAGAQRVRETRPLPVEPEEPSRNERHEAERQEAERREAAPLPIDEVRVKEPPPLPKKLVEEPIEPIVSDFDSVAEVIPASVKAIDEIEPLDYLQAEIQKIDRAREEFAHNESPSLGVHAIIAVVDLLTVAVSATPFLAVIQIMDGHLTDGRTQLAAGLIVLLVSFFYLAATQCLSGKTLGMMMTNTRIVDVHTFEPPSGQRLLLRTIGYFVALAPATLGLLWFVVDRYRRGWQDVISGTRVVRDF